MKQQGINKLNDFTLDLFDLFIDVSISQPEYFTGSGTLLIQNYLLKNDIECNPLSDNKIRIIGKIDPINIFNLFPLLLYPRESIKIDLFIGIYRFSVFFCVEEKIFYRKYIWIK